jgi:hypothetical protein
LFVSPLAEVAYGYEVVPIFHQKQQQASAMPSDDIKLEVGDRLVVLATVESLQRLAYGARLSPEYQVYIDRLLISHAEFEAIGTVARISGCEMHIATQVIRRLPDVLPMPLYKPQALRSVRELKKIQTHAHLIVPSSPG